MEREVCPGRGCQNTIGSYVCVTGKSSKNALLYEACPPGYQLNLRTDVCEGNEERVLLT